MPYARPTLTALRSQAMQDITASDLPNADGLLRRSALRVLAWVQAGFAYLHYGYLDWISRQSVPFTATDEYLAGWGGLKGIARNVATPASGSATFSGTVGTDIPYGSAITRADGFGYATTADASVGGGGTATVPVQATLAGAAGNADQGAVMILANPIAGVQSQGSAATALTGGADMETDDSLRTRMLQAYAAPPQGGDRQDYIEWALAVPGVTRAWVNPNGAGAGTVLVYVMLDQAEAAHGGFPQGSNGVAAGETRDTTATGDQLAVANAIYPQQPVTSLVYANAPTAAPVAFTISDLGTNNTTAMQAAITAALTDMFLRLGQVGGTVNPSTGAAWPSMEPSAWYAALEAVPGLTSFKVSTPGFAIYPSAGELFTLGTITFVT